MITRRKFLSDAALTGAASALGMSRNVFAADPPPETTRIRIPRIENVCWAPQ